MVQNSRKPGFQFLLIRSGINMSALCLPASCCRSQIFLQYFNSHFFGNICRLLFGDILVQKVPVFKLQFWLFSVWFYVFIWQYFKVGFLSRFFVSHSGEEAEEEEEEEKEEKRKKRGGEEEEGGWHKTQLYHIILAHLDSCLLSTNFAIYTSDKHEKF